MISLIGYIGMALTLISFTIDDMRKLRIVNLIGSLFWIVYGIGIEAGPTIGVNTIVVGIHSVWLYKNQKNRYGKP